ncbi:hypothetical protein [Microbacterium nymphoidis]|uniref:hypothetical protein n=1 Tax=Microbacterium nymphoidis TaxID=2898586 RepID=UPI001E2E4195|nr:hypothetical protein [Microbacterium nymphoidis]MCD2500039.1 hypothetical protein [Microbacterium nymphoidis]
MQEVWIVYHDSGPDNNILGVFAKAEDAEEYVAIVGPPFERGVLTSRFPVPWRSTDRVTQIRI